MEPRRVPTRVELSPRNIKSSEDDVHGDFNLNDDCLLAAYSGDSEHSGAEEAADGPGHLHEDGGLLLHRHLLRSSVQRGGC